MYQKEFEEFATKYITPTVSDIEAVKCTIIRELSKASHGLTKYIETEQLIRDLGSKLVTNYNPIPFPPECSGTDPDLNKARAEIAVREALQFLQSTGALISVGPLIDVDRPKQQIWLQALPRSSHIASFSIAYPSVFFGYRLAAPFAQGENFRLASGDIYLSHLNQTFLPSRAKRCLRECIDAFKHGLFLSAIMSIGAASESLWMRLGRLVRDKKPSSSKKLGEQLDRISPSISTMIDETWQVLLSQCSNELDNLFFNRGERDLFKKRADLFCERRNYAMHNEDADEDEPAFTYDETAIILLESVKYFNKMVDIIAFIDS